MLAHEKAKSKVGAAIGKLQDSGLLLAREGQYMHMHDLACDAASWVSHETHASMRHIMNKEAFSRRIPEEVTRLYCYDIYEVPHQLNLPKLEILYVSNCEHSPKFSDAFFETMVELKVLTIINTFVRGIHGLLCLPSIVVLKNLRTLCLNGWILEDISILGELKMLETIQLLRCEIKKLPNGLAKLRKLRSLEVSRSFIECDPFEVLSECSQLEELYFVGNKLWETVLDAHAVQLLHQIGSSEVLQRYHLEIGTPTFTLKNDLSSKAISLNDFDAFPSKAIKTILAQKLEVFHLDNIRGHFGNIIPDMIPAEGEYMNELIELSLCDFYKVECLIDNVNHQLSHDRTVFSKLLKLRLYRIRQLKALYYGQPPSGLFEKLEELLITACPRLRFIVSSDMLNLSNLKYLKLSRCQDLESLFTYSTAQTMISLQVLKVKNCDILKHIITPEGADDILSIRTMFPKLKKVIIKTCHNMRYIMPASFAGGLLELEILEIIDAPALEHVFGEDNEAVVQNRTLTIDLPVLQVFKLMLLENIIRIAPDNCRVSCPSLDSPHVWKCPKLIITSGLDLKERQQSDGEGAKQDLGLPTKLRHPMSEPATNMEPNSEPESLPDDYKSPEDEKDTIVTVDEEHCNDNDAEDKGEKEAEQDKEEKYGIPKDSSRVIDESNKEITKVSFHKDSAPEESTVGTSSKVLVDKQPQIVTDPQQALQECEGSLPLPVDSTVLSPSTSIPTTSSSTKQHPTSEEFVDFHGLFKIKERQARLLEEAFAKYPHLWEWKLSQKTLRICKGGYKSLADMLAFLNSETPKTMNDSKMEEFENLYYEVEYFGFDQMWLTSIRERVMDMQADYDNKLKLVDQLESQIRDAQASLANVKDYLSKPSHVFGF